MRYFVVILFMLFYAHAQSFLISSIPLPKTYVLNTDIDECDNQCLHKLLADERIFSFLAHAKDRFDDPALNDALLIQTALFNVERMRQYTELKIAMLLPYRVIGRYAYSTTNAAFAYYLTKNRTFELRTYNVESENKQDLKKVLKKIEDDNFHYVIAPLTLKGARNVASLNLPMHIYFPTVNKNDLNVSTGEYLYFGGINYKKQIKSLMSYTYNPLTVFYDKNNLGKKLTDITKREYIDAFENNETKDRLVFKDRELFSPEDTEELKHIDKLKFYSYAIAKRTSNLESRLKKNHHIQDGSIFLNTPVVKSAMVVSQITLYDLNISNILSTQINYNPELLLLTQPKDRKKMLIANSINYHNNIMIESNSLLQNNIVYDWINYATTIGADYFYHLTTSSHREYPQKMLNNQIQYRISIVKPTYSRFIIVKPPE